MEPVILEQMVPENHLLRKIDRSIDITPANVNDVDPVPDILDDIEKRLGHLPTYMGVDAGYHNASRGIQPVVGYRRHTHKGELFGKFRERFGALTDQHMARVMDRLNRQVKPFSNIRDNLLTVLFRAAADGEDEHDQAVSFQLFLL